MAVLPLDDPIMSILTPFDENHAGKTVSFYIPYDGIIEEYTSWGPPPPLSQDESTNTSS